MSLAVLPRGAASYHWRMPEPQASAVEAALEEVNPDALSPREALELLYRLKQLSAEPSDS